MVISGGNLGIGTISPGYPLHVVGKIYSSTEGQFGNAIAKNNSGIATFGSNSTATTIKINLDASATRNNLVIEGSTGNIGISTASPSAKLTTLGITGTTIIQALGADSNGFADVEIKSTGTTGASRLFFSDTAAQSGFIKYNHSDNSMQFGTNGLESMLLTQSSLRISNTAGAGNLIIGTSSISGYEN